MVASRINDKMRYRYSEYYYGADEHEVQDRIHELEQEVAKYREYMEWIHVQIAYK